MDNPLNFDFRKLLATRDLQTLLDKRLQTAGSIEKMLAMFLDAPLKSDISPDEKLGICAGLWDSLPEKHADLAAIALKALADAYDADVKTAERLRGYIPDFDARDDLKKSFQKIRAVARAKQKYYFRTRYQARDMNRLRAQLFPTPPMPISNGAHFICIGSCFAVNLGIALMRRGVKNAFAIRYQDDTDPISILSGVMRDEGFKQQVIETPEIVVVLTAGFAEAHGDFLKPEAIAETIKDMNVTLKQWSPGVRFFVTVSPVPLSGTATGLSPYEANAISKSIMRLGVEEARKAGVEYFPSYELATQHFNAIGISPFGVFDGSPSHVNEDAVLFITDLFISQYLPWIDLTAEELPQAVIPMREIS